jgi:hypothetical protein
VAVDADNVSEVGEDLRRRIRKPSAYVHYLQGSEGVTGGPHQFARGLQVPTEGEPVQKPGRAYAVSIINNPSFSAPGGEERGVG